MTRILVVADEPWVRNEVHAALSTPDTELIDHDDPSTAAAAAVDNAVDVVVVDLQIGSMGGMAVTRSILEKAEHFPVVMLLDRAADAFIAHRAGAGAWVTKPVEAHELRDAVRSVGAAAP